MRSYTVATVALTLGVTPKWVDNALSRFPVAGVVQKGQGIRRRLAPRSVLSLYIAIELGNSLGLQLTDALRLGQMITADDAPSRIGLFPSAFLTIDIEAVTRELGERLAQAVEITPVPRRGRPPLK
ncbi:MAG: hypothetical protein ABJC63_04840 [Gemmatimonadales bacterium]